MVESVASCRNNLDESGVNTAGLPRPKGRRRHGLFVPGGSCFWVSGKLSKPRLKTRSGDLSVSIEHLEGYLCRYLRIRILLFIFFGRVIFALDHNSPTLHAPLHLWY